VASRYKPFKDLWRPFQRRQFWYLARQLFMRANDEITLRQDVLQKERQYPRLKRGRKIGESEIAAKHQVELPLGRCRPNVLLQEIQVCTMPWAHAKAIADSVKGLSDKVRRQFAQARGLEAALTRSVQHRLVDVRRRD
jgi:hypothetical protein